MFKLLTHTRTAAIIAVVAVSGSAGAVIAATRSTLSGARHTVIATHAVPSVPVPAVKPAPAVDSTAPARSTTAISTAARSRPSGSTGHVSATAPATTPLCHVADLGVRLAPASPAAGQRYATLSLTNNSYHACHTYGYVGMLLLDRFGHAMPTDVARTRTAQPQRVVLAPRDSAASLLHWSVVPGTADETGPCVSSPRELEVTPPDEYNHLTILWYQGIVCERGHIDVTPLQLTRVVGA